MDNSKGVGDMKNVLLAAAVSLAALALPATAEARDRGGAQFAAGPAGVTVHLGNPGGFDGGFQHDHHGRDRDRHDRRRHRDFDGGFLIGSWDREWQGDTAWRADSYNDWWHERPWRSYPRWVQNNQNCEPDRMWWSGGGWHC
jgi:hypothetical protein